MEEEFPATTLFQAKLSMHKTEDQIVQIIINSGIIWGLVVAIANAFRKPYDKKILILSSMLIFSHSLSLLPITLYHYNIHPSGMLLPLQNLFLF